LENWFNSLGQSWSKLGWRSRFFILAWAATGFFILSAKFGLIDLTNGERSETKRFDRLECLRRKQEELFPGMFIDELSDSARSDVAAACAHEQHG
jgi:hypothetical protein